MIKHDNTNDYHLNLQAEIILFMREKWVILPLSFIIEVIFHNEEIVVVKTILFSCRVTFDEEL